MDVRRLVAVAVGLSTGTTTVSAATASAATGHYHARAGAEAGTLSGRLWFDRNQNQVQDDGEPSRGERGVILLYQDGTFVGGFDTDENGQYQVIKLSAGDYQVTYRDAEKYVPTTSAVVDVTIGAEPAVADFGMKGASVSGTQWLDSDFDGLRDPGEPDLDPFLAVNPTSVSGPVHQWGEQDERGAYRVDDLPAGDGYVVNIAGPLGMPLTREGGDSDVDWITGESAPFALAPGEDLTGVDAGYADVTGDTALTDVTVDPPTRKVRVGDQLTVTLTFTNKGPVPDHIFMEMYWPAGLDLVDVDAEFVSLIQQEGLIANSWYMLEPGASTTMTVVLAAVAPDRGTVTASVTPGPYGDSDSRNDAKSFTVRLVR